MKRVIKFEVSILVECPKSWSAGQMEGLAKETIGNSRIGGGGCDGSHRASFKKVRRLK